MHCRRVMPTNQARGALRQPVPSCPRLSTSVPSLPARELAETAAMLPACIRCACATLNPLADSSSLSWPTAKDSHELAGRREPPRDGADGAVCSSVCTPVGVGEIEAAVANLTRLLARTDDARVVADIVRERAALRQELHCKTGERTILDEARARAMRAR